MATGTGNLPATIDTVSPFDTIVSAWGNAVKNDIYALADGTGIGDGAVSTAKLADASVTNAKLATTTGEPGGAWESYTVTSTNFTVGTGGSASLTGYYKKVGNTIHYRIKGILGTSGQSVGTGPTFSLPVASINYGSTYKYRIGSGMIDDAGILYPLMAAWVSTTTVAPLVYAQANTYISHASPSATIPMTWAAGDSVYIYGEYEAA